jgi:hypothetical protein
MERLTRIVNFIKPFFEHAKFKLWTMWIFGPVMLLYALALTSAVLWLNWPVDLAAKRLDYIGWALLGTLVLVGLSSFFMTGFISSVKISAGAASLEVEGDDDRDGLDGPVGGDGGDEPSSGDSSKS